MGVILKISKDGELVYQTSLSLENLNNYEWKRVYTNLSLDSGKDYTIELKVNESST